MGELYNVSNIGIINLLTKQLIYCKNDEAHQKPESATSTSFVNSRVPARLREQKSEENY